MCPCPPGESLTQILSQVDLFYCGFYLKAASNGNFFPRCCSPAPPVISSRWMFSQCLWGKGWNISIGNLHREYLKGSTHSDKSIPWMCSRSAHPEFVSKQTLQEWFPHARMVFCADLESKNFWIIAYSNKEPVTYWIFWLIGELIAYLTMLKLPFCDSLRRERPLWGLLKWRNCVVLKVCLSLKALFKDYRRKNQLLQHKKPLVQGMGAFEEKFCC